MSRRNWSRGSKTELRCRGCLTKKAAHAHHVVYEQELNHRGLPPYDRRNRMALCVDCHFGQHRNKPLPVSLLSDENMDYAFEVLGAFAYDYLKRRYSGHDDRLDDHLQRASEAA